jgi:Virulence factor membrane-bound polymerase, C-terminal/O-Antigen ligase
MRNLIKLQPQNTFSVKPWLLGCMAIAGFISWSIANHYPPWIGFHNDVAAFVWALLVALYLLLGSPLRPTHKLAWSSLDAVVLLLLATMAMQQAIGRLAYPAITVVGSLYILTAYVINLAFRASSFKKEDFEGLLMVVTWGLIVAGLFAGFIVLYQFFSLSYLTIFAIDHPQCTRPFGNLGQANHAATLFVIALACTLVCYERRIIHALGLGALGAFFLLGLVLTESRASYVALIALILWWAFGKNKVGLRLSFAAIASAVVIFGVLFLVVAPIFREWVACDNGRAFLPVGGVSARALVASQIFAALRQQWALGFGFMQVSDAQSAGILSGAIADNFGENFTYSHNIFLDLVAWFGVPIGGALFLILAWSLLKKMRAIHTSTQWCLVACMCPIVVHSFTEYPLAYGYFLFPLVFWYSLLMVLASTQQPESGLARTCEAARHAILVLITVLAGLGILVAYEYLRLEENHRIARFNALRVGKIPVGYAAYKPVLLHQLADLNAAAFVDVDQVVTANNKLMFKKLTTAYPDFWIQGRYIRILLREGDHSAAVRQLSILRGKLMPVYFNAFLRDLPKPQLCDTRQVLPAWITTCEN